ncbi:MAG: DUF2298 domain-containing protein, partial [Chloroflexota bacterium]
WFAGGYINYYYYGFVFVGTLVKLLGVVPAVAYNLIIPTLFAMLCMNAFSVAWNLISVRGKQFLASSTAWWVGISAAVGTGLLGNMGSLQMIIRGYQQLGAAGGYSADTFFIIKWGWAIKGVLQNISGLRLPYYVGDWYWNPSRVIPAPNDVQPITEFPWFTFIYADLHAHMIALPITMLVIAWILSVVKSRAWQGKSVWQALGGLVFGGFLIGSLRPTNTWDFPTYLALGMVGVLYAVLRKYEPAGLKEGEQGARIFYKIAVAVGGASGLGFLAFVLYQPFSKWYVQGYSEINHWTGSHTPTGAYFTHWGLFLFIIISWMIWETRQWMAKTPLSSLRKLDPYQVWIGLAGVFFTVALGILLIIEKAHVSWFVLPLIVWAGILILRPGMSEGKRMVLFMVGTSFFLTIMVEVIVLVGDIGRMNTVFKFYLQVWVMFAVSSAAALGWLLKEYKFWLPSWRTLWQVGFASLLGAASLFPLVGTAAKIQDRMSQDAPRSLDGMAYMNYVEYYDVDTQMDLSQDYQAIQWMQQNISGSPVIVEANTPIYMWGSRYSIYTGLPSVLGWDWHQMQQRVVAPPQWIPERKDAILEFYTTTDIQIAIDFIADYDISYIIVGELEKVHYPG